MGSRRWPGSIPRAARPAAPGGPPPPSGSPGGAQGRLRQGLPRGSAASALMNTSRGSPSPAGFVSRGHFMAHHPLPPICTLSPTSVHTLKGIHRPLLCSRPQPATLLQGCDPECVLRSPGGLLGCSSQVLVRPEILPFSSPPRGVAHAASPQTTFPIGRIWSDPVPWIFLQRRRCPIFRLYNVFPRRYPQEPAEQSGCG